MSDRDIIESIRQMTGTHLDDRVHLVAATVDSVNISARTCNVTTISGKESTAMEGAKLMATVDDGVLLIPSVGSTVFISYSNYNVPFVTMYSALDQILLISGNSQVSIVDSKIMLNDGSYGGLVEIIPLVTKLNNLENLVNDLIQKFNTHTHILALSAGTGTAAATTSTEPTVLTPTVKSNLENTLITHGK